VTNTSAQPPAPARSNSDQTKTKSEMKIQKRTRILDSYRLEEKIPEKMISDLNK
jgi:hypothetical protein